MTEEELGSYSLMLNVGFAGNQGGGAKGLCQLCGNPPFLADAGNVARRRQQRTPSSAIARQVVAERLSAPDLREFYSI